ncbi:MAG: molybdopterin biosynthesis protein [Gemmataceae bacterium]|nr:molybdopterin biosynthesis protein [Gemmataceae bacterium]
MKQDQFLNVIDRDEAERRFRAALDLRPLAAEEVTLDRALGRVLARDVIAPVDVPSFDRSNVDGFAVRAEDTFAAAEDRPQRLRLSGEALVPGVPPRATIQAGVAAAIATGAMLPRGADAVVMVEHTDALGAELLVRRPVAPGANISGAGGDIGRGETVLRRGELVTSRETGVLAALGVTSAAVVRKPRVAILSTGNELIAPGQPMRPGLVYDSNATILADAVRELGGEPVHFGIAPDERELLAELVRQALHEDVVLLSGGTSKGEGDLSYRVVAELGQPGIIVHGVALKPGKPLCLAAVSVQRSEVGGQKSEEYLTSDFRPLTSEPLTSDLRRVVPVVVLPGFPTSAIFTFHEFVAPVIRSLAGRRQDAAATVAARLPLRVNSERGRTEYLLVGLVKKGPDTFFAYPMGKGSGSVTTFSRADGFVVIPRQQEYVAAGTEVRVHLLGQGLQPADLVVIGSHCVGLDYLLGRLHDQGWRTKFLAVGSTGGLEAARRGECDIAGIHLLDEATQQYNRPFVGAGLCLVEGYRRLQGIVFRPGDARFAGRTVKEAMAHVLADADCIMINRNRGSGTRVLIDRLLHGIRPPGYSMESRSHNAVVAAVEQGRADWGVAIEIAAKNVDLGFLPLQEEHFDFVMPEDRLQSQAVQQFTDNLGRKDVRKHLRHLMFRLD